MFLERQRRIRYVSARPFTPQDVHWEVKDHTKRECPNALVAKALGGCGIHNAMLYVRALESDFDKWDVQGFDYATATRAWKAMEDYMGDEQLPSWHGRGGPIVTSPPSFIDEARTLSDEIGCST